MTLIIIINLLKFGCYSIFISLCIAIIASPYLLHTSPSSSNNIDACVGDSSDANKCEALRRQLKNDLAHAKFYFPIMTVKHKS